MPDDGFFRAIGRGRWLSTLTEDGALVNHDKSAAQQKQASSKCREHHYGFDHSVSLYLSVAILEREQKGEACAGDLAAFG